MLPKNFLFKKTDDGHKAYQIRKADTCNSVSMVENKYYSYGLPKDSGA